MEAFKPRQNRTETLLLRFHGTIADSLWGVLRVFKSCGLIRQKEKKY